MTGGRFERVERLDAPAVHRAMVDAGGPAVALVRPLPGGAVGAWQVRWPDGHHGVLTWVPAGREGQPAPTPELVQELMGLARRAGVPLPAWEAVVELGPLGTVVLQEHVTGTVPGAMSDGLVEQLVQLAELRRGLLAGTALAGQTMPLHLASSGPGFCLHEPLRAFGPRTAALLGRIEAVGELHGDRLVGDDVVHYDYHPGNVLVDPHRPGEVTAIVDWAGACPGRIELDLAILAFDLTWRTPGRRQEQVEDHLRRRTDPTTFAMVWAHASLRLLDWSIRHHPHDVDHWCRVAERHLLNP